MLTTSRLKALLFFLIVLFVNLQGCSRPMYSKAVPSNLVVAPESRQHMAYEHWVQLDTDETKVATVFGSLQAICKEAVNDQCVVMSSRLNTGRNVVAELRLRAKPLGIKKLIEVLSMQGEVTNQSTKAEDLSGPIEDSSKKLEMLRDYRTKLEGLRGNATRDIDALIKINKELSEVQSKIEEITGEKSRLTQRVVTEILNIEINSKQHDSFWNPIVNALSDFKSNFSQALSSVVTSIAYIIPWAFIFLIIGWFVRKLWVRRFTRNKQT